jgi:hypothetical protein
MSRRRNVDNEDDNEAQRRARHDEDDYVSQQLLFFVVFVFFLLLLVFLLFKVGQRTAAVVVHMALGLLRFAQFSHSVDRRNKFPFKDATYRDSQQI